MSKTTEGKYLRIWQSYAPTIANVVLKNEQKNIQLDKKKFIDVGDRDISDYNFHLEMKNGVVKNNIGGTAVARDLVKVITRSEHIMKIISNTYLILIMDKNCLLSIQFQKLDIK